MCVHVDVPFVLHLQHFPSAGRPYLFPLSLPLFSPVIFPVGLSPPFDQNCICKVPGAFVTCHLARGPDYLPEHFIHVASRTPQSPCPPAALGHSFLGSLPIFPYLEASFSGIQSDQFLSLNSLPTQDAVPA